MHYLAFDVSKHTLDAVLTNLRTKSTPIHLQNTREAIAAWLNQATLPRRLIVGCESTGGYHVTLGRVFMERGYTFKILNPLLTKQFIKTTIRKKKTDASDCLIIAKLLAQGEGSSIDLSAELVVPRIEQRMLKTLIHEKSKFTLLRQSLTAYEAHESLHLLDERLRFFSESLQHTEDTYRREMQARYRSHPTITLLESIPGIGFQTALTIWTEIGSIARFDSEKEVIAYAGLDPKISQSGITLHHAGRLTKRGSPYLRGALFLAANVARRWDPDLRAYYEKKRSEGKTYTTAVCATARKLVGRVYAVWKRGTPYVIRGAAISTA